MAKKFSGVFFYLLEDSLARNGVKSEDMVVFLLFNKYKAAISDWMDSSYEYSMETKGDALLNDVMGVNFHKGFRQLSIIDEPGIDILIYHTIRIGNFWDVFHETCSKFLAVQALVDKGVDEEKAWTDILWE